MYQEMATIPISKGPGLTLRLGFNLISHTKCIVFAINKLVLRQTLSK